MPTVTVKKKSGAKAKAAKPASKAKAAAKSKAASTNSKPRADVNKQRAEVAKQIKQGKKMGDIADSLGVSAGRAKYLDMLNQVEDGSVSSISTNGNEDAVAKRIIAARQKQDEHSSWGWISARTGMAEVRVKSLAEEHGMTVKGSHVAKERAAARPGKGPKGKGPKAKVKGRKATASNPS